MSDQPAQEPDNRLVGFYAGLGIAGLGVIIGVSTFMMKVGVSYAKVGPRAVPFVVAAALTVLGLAFALQCRRQPRPAATAADPAAPAAELMPPLLISAGMILDIVLMERLGFVVASIVLFLAVAYAFGSRRVLRDAAIAVLVSLAAYLGFTHGLGLQLPAGILKGIV